METVITALVCAASVTLFTASSAQAQDASEMAKKLANPIASLINVPIQTNYDEGFGDDDDGEKWVTNIQPVIPFSTSEDWNVISRTTLPVQARTSLSKDGNDVILDGERTNNVTCCLS